MSRFDWDKLRRHAEQEYEKSGEGRRRREAGSQAAAQAEELAWWALHRPDTPPVSLGGFAGDPDAVRATALAADQSVYVYRHGVLLAHMPPSTIWNIVETPTGMELRTQLMSSSRGEYVGGPRWAPGEWTFCGRGHEGV